MGERHLVGSKNREFSLLTQRGQAPGHRRVRHLCVMGAQAQDYKHEVGAFYSYRR